MNQMPEGEIKVDDAKITPPSRGEMKVSTLFKSRQNLIENIVRWVMGVQWGNIGQWVQWVDFLLNACFVFFLKIEHYPRCSRLNPTFCTLPFRVVRSFF